MYHQPSKRKLIIQRVVTYGLMTLSVIALVVVLVFVMLGYQFNSNDGKLEQGGLVQFDSQPSGADVTIDGNGFGTQTASKTTMTAGQHSITIGRPGYDTWKKSIDVVPGTVLWLNYARLIPSNLSPKAVIDLAGATSAVASGDKKKIAVQENASTSVIRVADISKDNPTISTLALPEGSYAVAEAGKKSHFSIETWDPDDRYLLVKHVYDDKAEWIVVDTEDVKNTKNITKLLDIEASKIVFSNSDSKVLYAQIGADVRKVNLNDATLSRPLITNVAQFALYSDTMITYATQVNPDNGTRSVGYYVDGADQPRTVRTYTDNGEAPLRFIVGRYFSDTFEAIAYGDTVEILMGDLPRDNKTPLTLKSVATMSLPGGAQYLVNKTNGRFFMAQNGPVYVTYDLELKKMTTTTLKGSSEITKQLEWLDNYMVWSDRDSMLRLYEFDGQNQHDIMQVAPGMTASLSPSGKYLYGITKSDKGAYHLSRVQLQGLN